MSGTTLNGTIYVGVTLGTGHSSTPYTIGSRGAIEPTNEAAYGLFANSSYPFATVANFGIVADGTSGTAIEFADVGNLLNAGTIEGANSYPGAGVYLIDGGTVTNTNAGLITAYRIAVHGVDVAATVENSGTIVGQVIGIRLSGGGLVRNNAAGVITGEYAVQGHINASTVVNSGTIIGQYTGVGLYGGQITNLAGGTISELLNSDPSQPAQGPTLLGKVAAYINDGTGTITNYGVINGYYGAALLTGGLITNATGARIMGAASGYAKAAYISGGYGTIINAGLLQAVYGAVLEDGGTIVNQAGGTITGKASAEIFGRVGYITNAGLLSGGVLLGNEGTVTNDQSGSISGGVVLDGGTLLNSGQISAAVYGVTGEDPVTIVNLSGAVITGGKIGIFLDFGGGSVFNAGTISGTRDGISVSYQNGALSPKINVNNSGVISSVAGNFAVAIYAGKSGASTILNTGYINRALSLSTGGGLGTVINAGTIGTLGGSSAFGNNAILDTARGTLILDAGQFLNDGIATFGAGSELDLAAGKAEVGTLVNPGSYFGFTALNVESGANWQIGNATGGVSVPGITSIQDFGTLTIAGSLLGVSIDMEGSGATAVLTAPPSATFLSYPNGQNQADDVSLSPAQIRNFGAGDTIDLGVSLIPALPIGDHFSAVYSNGTLMVSEINAAGIFQNSAIVSITGTGLASGNFSISSGPDGIVVTDIPCFAAGTRILTQDGQRPIEVLRAGDKVLTVSDSKPKTIIWAGQRSIDLGRHTNPDKAIPVIILAGAMGEGVPERNLTLSPDHALLIDGYLIEAKTLVNGATIIRDMACRFVTYHHIELEQHNVVLAEGLPAETYLDSGNRANFEADAAPTILHPDFTAACRDAACAKLLLDDDILRLVRQKLLARALALGFRRTNKIDLEVRVGTARIVPQPSSVLDATELTFVLPSGATTISLCSSTGVPAELYADPSDRRVLGAAITGLALIVNGQRIVIDVQDKALEGFHTPEPGQRWTTGQAYVTLPSYRGRAVLEVTLKGQAMRWEPGNTNYSYVSRKTSKVR